MSAASDQVGFVGLGRMGWPMARNLRAAGFDLLIYDANEDVGVRFADEHGATVASGPEGFSATGIVVTMLPTDAIVRQAVLDWGIADALPGGALVIDMSSSHPSGTIALGNALAERGIETVDAPVSGGVARAEDATLSIMVGGDDAQFARAEPVLEALGSRLFRTGPLGSAHALKALNNFLAATAYAATAEALEVGRHYGLEPGTIIDVVNTSTGRSFASEVVFGEHVLPGAYATGFALGLLAKDVGIASDLAHRTGVEAPICDLVHERWTRSLEALGPDVDHSKAHIPWWPSDVASYGKEPV